MARSDRTHPSQILTQTPEERVPDLSLGRLRAILDLGQKLRFNSDALLADALGIGLGSSDKGFKPLLQFGGRDLVKAVVDFTGVDEIVALATADIEAIPFRANRERSRQWSTSPAARRSS